MRIRRNLSNVELRRIAENYDITFLNGSNIVGLSGSQKVKTFHGEDPKNTVSFDQENLLFKSVHWKEWMDGDIAHTIAMAITGVGYPHPDLVKSVRRQAKKLLK